MSNLFDEWAAAQNWNISKPEKTYIEVPEYSKLAINNDYDLFWNTVFAYADSHLNEK